jgi:hypothetical protein
MKQALLKLAKLLVEKQEFDAAIEKYLYLIPLERTNTTHWDELAMCFYQKGKYLMVISLEFTVFIFLPKTSLGSFRIRKGQRDGSFPTSYTFSFSSVLFKNR